jgi:hypothetical protein
MLQLSSGRTPRRVEISDFKGSKLINIREYYEKDDEWLPGKKVFVIAEVGEDSPDRTGSREFLLTSTNIRLSSKPFLHLTLS